MKRTMIALLLGSLSLMGCPGSQSSEAHEQGASATETYEGPAMTDTMTTDTTGTSEASSAELEPVPGEENADPEEAGPASR